MEVAIVIRILSSAVIKQTLDTKNSVVSKSDTVSNGMSLLLYSVEKTLIK